MKYLPVLGLLGVVMLSAGHSALATTCPNNHEHDIWCGNEEPPEDECDPNDPCCNAGGGGGSGGGGGPGGGLGGVGTSSINPYNANKRRHVTDLQTFGAASIAFTRIYNSRTTTFTTNFHDFGWRQTWQHNWNFEVRDIQTGTNGHNTVKVRYPSGAEFNFMATDTNGIIRVPYTYHGDRLYKWSGSPAGHTLVKANGWEYDFQRTTSPRYRLVRVRDGQGATWTMGYYSSGKLKRIENDFGRWLEIDYAVTNGVSCVASVSSSDGRQVQYQYETWAYSVVLTTMTAVVTTSVITVSGEDGTYQQSIFITNYIPEIITNLVSSPVLSGVQYPDGSEATYTYVGAQDITNGRPLLYTASDPLHPGAGARVKYIPNYDAVFDFGNGPYLVTGTVLEERNLDTDELVARMPFGAGDFPYILLGDGTEIIQKYTNGLLIEKHDGEGRPSYYSRDQGGLGYINAVTDGLSNTTTFVRDYAGRILAQGDPLGYTNYFAYNDAGFRTNAVDVLGRTTSYTRDTNNFLVRVDYPGGGFEEWTRNAFGQPLTHIQRSGGTNVYVYYDGMEEGGLLGDLKSLTDAMGHTTTYTWDDAGLAVSRSDALSNTTVYAHDWRGQLLETTHPDGATVARFYDPFGNLTNSVNALGLETSFTYDHFNRRKTQRDPLDRVTEYEYGHASGCSGCTHHDLVSKIIDPSGRVTEYTYDNSGKRTSETIAADTPDASTKTWTYDSVGRQISMTYPSGLVVSNTYDAMGRRIRETFLSDNTYNEWHYDPDGVRTQINRLGQTTLYDYNEIGKHWRVTDPLGRQTSYAYDTAGNAVAITNANGSVTYYTYDLLNRVTSSTDCGGLVVSNVYDELGRVSKRIDANSITNEYFYDVAGRLLWETRGGETLYQNEYNIAGWLMGRTDGAGITVTNLYDDAGRLTRSFWPDQTFTETQYTNSGVWKQIDRAGRTTTFHRDILGRVTNQVDNANETVSYVYDQAGRMTHLIDQGGTPTIWDYDQEGRQIAKIYADGSTNSYTYNALGQLTTKSDALGRPTHYRYDAVGNLTNIHYQTDAPVSFTYDNLNRVTTMVDGIGLTEYTYATDCGAVATVTSPFGDVVSYGYDPGKRLTNVAFHGESRGYTLDPLNRIAAVSAFGAEHEYAYIGTTHRPTQLTRPNDTLTDYHYDGLGRLTNLVHRGPGGGVFSSFGYALDDADQRTQVRREDGFQIDYDYDPIGQLVAAEGSEPGWQFGYQYDERGNPLRREHSGFVRSNSFNALNQQAESLWSGGAVILGAVSTTNAIIEINNQPAFAWGLEGMLVFGATNLAVQAGSNEFVAVVSDIFGRSDTNAITVNVQDQAFAYDRNGNLTNDGVRVYSWDQADRLVEVRDLQTDELLVQNRYDGLGRRRERIMASVAGGEDPGSTNRYVYDGWLVVAVLDGDNDVLEQYVHGMDLSGTREGAGGIGGILQVVGDEVAYYHYDGNGNVTTITDHQGTSISHLEYDPFGRVLVTDGPYAPRYQFSSKEYDAATRLNYYGYRYYLPQLGRWLNRDPIGERGGINQYSAVNNNPFRYIDPLGLNSKKVEKCNIQIFVTHASSAPDEIENEDCSAAAHVACKARVVGRENTKIQNPLPTQGNTTPLPPTGRVRDVYNSNEDYISPEEAANQANQHWDAAMQEAQEICKSKDGCCKEVKVEIDCSGLDFVYRLSMPRGVCGRGKTVRCKDN